MIRDAFGRPIDLEPIRARLMSRVDIRPDGCWQWLGYIEPEGYGRISVGGKKGPGRPGRVVYVHRVSYELDVGEVPEGMELDHLCRNRACLNPGHLEAVAHKVNLLRGVAPTVLAHHNGRCLRGHEMTPHNVVVKARGRECRRCNNDRQAKYRNRQTA